MEVDVPPRPCLRCGTLQRNLGLYHFRSATNWGDLAELLMPKIDVHVMWCSMCGNVELVSPAAGLDGSGAAEWTCECGVANVASDKTCRSCGRPG